MPAITSEIATGLRRYRDRGGDEPPSSRMRSLIGDFLLKGDNGNQEDELVLPKRDY